MFVEDSKGRVEIQASNARFPVDAALLRLEPDCNDPIMADVRSTYGDNIH